MANKYLDGGIPSFDERGKKEYVPAVLKGYMSALKNRHKYARQARDLYYPSPAGYNDPLTQMCVLDLVMRLSPTDQIRAKYLWKLLQHTHPQVIWNPVVVGVVLNEIAHICEENFSDPKMTPLVSKRDFSGLKFKLQPTAAGWQWLDTMRDFAAERAVEVAKATANGDKVRRQSSIWVDLPPRITPDVDQA